eukprot:jgi/Undpi1/10489/HiC_scaffold_29.g12939.m1
MPVQSSGQSKFLAQIKENISRSAPNHVIGKYLFDDLWVHPPTPTMLKTLDLEDHQLCSVFVWIPELTFPAAFSKGRPPCPRRKTTSRVIAKGFTQKESRRAILRNYCCDLLGYFCHCHGYKSNNMGKEKSAVHADVLEEITDNLVHTKGFAASRAALEQAHLKKFHARELKYYNMLLWRKQNVLLQPITAVRDIGSFIDPDGYNGFVPSEHYRSSVWCDVMQNRPVAKLDNLVQGVEGEERWSRELFCHLRQQSIDGKVLKVDGSHKYVKLVRVFDSGAAGGTKPVHCMVTFFNVFEQVVFQKASRSASLRELKADVKLLFATRYTRRRFQLPTVLYTDMCCEDRELMVEIFREMRHEGNDFSVDDDMPTSSDGPIFQLPPDVRQIDCIHASRNTNLVRAGVDKLRQEARVRARVLGLDIEWEVSRAGAPPNPPATIQLATGKVVVIFHVLHGQRTSPDKLPQSLACLLENAGLAKTGVGIKGDCTRHQRFFGVEVRNVVDLPGLALQRKVKMGRRRSLADLCLHVLGQRLQKDQHLRLSRWNVAELGEEKRGESEELHPGDSVRLYTRGDMSAWEEAASSSTERRHGVQQASSSLLDVLPAALLDGGSCGC